jgi:hypothetical protein
MIISESVNIKITNKNLKFYQNLGFLDISIGFELKIPVSKLPKGSNLLIKVQCDYCGLEKEVSYKNYNKSLKIGNRYSCSQKCSYKKKSEILLLNKGVENPFQLDFVKEKIKETNLERRGVTHHTKSNQYKEEYKSKSLEKWGVENPMMLDDIKDKVKKTTFERWGGIGFGSDEISDKIKWTNLQKWGTTTPTNLIEIKEKIKETTLKNWDGIGFGSSLIREKIIKSTIENWGEDSNTKSENFRKLNYRISKDLDYIRYFKEGISIFQCPLGHQFQIHKNNYISRKKSNVDLCTVCNPIGETSSLKEINLLEFIESLGVNYIKSYRENYEIDIYLPDYKLGIEFNGLWWHSSEKKERGYHLKKTEFFGDRGIRIIHIWEDDWDNKRDIIKSQIKNLLGFSKKIGARKCRVVPINSKIGSEFLDKNHIQGSYRGVVYMIGLFYGEELVSLMTFDRFEGRKKMGDGEWNLSRFCNKLETSVTGGASKLLKYFIREMNPKRVISYADRDWSRGDLYKNLGFKTLYETKPDYKYLYKRERVHKSRFRKSRTGISESKLELPKVWDCGKIKFERLI